MNQQLSILVKKLLTDCVQDTATRQQHESSGATTRMTTDVKALGEPPLHGEIQEIQQKLWCLICGENEGGRLF